MPLAFKPILHRKCIEQCREYAYWYQGIKGKQISGISAEEKLCRGALNIVLEFKQEQGWLKSTELYH